MFRRRASRSSSIIRKLSDTTLDSYSDFKSHLMSTDEPSDNSEDGTKFFPATNNQDVRQVSPQELKLKKPLNRLLLDVQDKKMSKVAVLNKKGISVTRKPAEVNQAANGVVNNNYETRSLSNGKENNLSDNSTKLEVTEKRIKRKLFDTEMPSKSTTKKSKIVQDEKMLNNETNKSLPGLSDTAVSIFLQKFDQEMAIESVGQPVNNLVLNSALPSIEDLSKAERDNQGSYNKLPKRKTAHESQKIVTQLLQDESLSLAAKNNCDSDDSFHDKDFKVNEGDLISDGSSTSEESENNQENRKVSKNMYFLRRETRTSVSSEAASISSTISTTSRYGRIIKSVPQYINAAIFGGGSTKSEVKQRASTLINSHKCKNRPSALYEETSMSYPDQVDLLSPTRKRNNSPELKKPANQVTPSKNRRTTRRTRSRRLSSTSQKSLLNEDPPDKQKPNQFDFLSPPHNNQVALQLQKSANQTTSSSNGSNLSNSRRSQSRTSNNKSLKKSSLMCEQTDLISPPRNKSVSPQFDQSAPSTSGNTCSLPEEAVFKKPLHIRLRRNTHANENSETSPKSKKIVIHQNVVVRPPNKEENPVELNNLPRAGSLARTLRSSVSNASFKTPYDNFDDVFDNAGRELDPNEIHSVVNDEVVSCKWYSPEPDLDKVLSTDNVHYSMPDLRSFYTNVMVGYIKIDVGRKRLMQVLRDSIMLYFVERGEAIFRVSEREITGQIGSTFFIPLGVEYTITNSKTEDLILKFVKMSPTASGP